ncbi:alpha/beta fold hydrolase [Nocardiopsis xinjiangensis]|uniref:alpha/beta fold hydrolase n=1 Tax=Nocardiopsis xinjiangensis TaxID=124285 RepID=UPI000369D976|nr:alpha/beta hydrolase [Nocardiopsis xinjiangensis]
MSERVSRGTHIYRTPSGADKIRTWCEERLATWPGLERLPAVDTALGTTRAFLAPGGERTPVVMLPGTNFNTATNVDILRVLAADRPVISVDPPGQPGLSGPMRPRGDRTAAYGAWFGELLPQLVDGPVIVLGHALGAAMALDSTPSPLVSGLMLVDPAGLSAAGAGGDLMRVTLPWMIGPRDSKSARVLNMLHGENYQVDASDPMARWWTLVGTHCRYVLSPPPLEMESLRPWHDTPTVLATGSEDVLYSPSRLYGPALRLLNAEVVELEGAGHLAPYEQPERIAELLGRLDH